MVTTEKAPLNGKMKVSKLIIVNLFNSFLLLLEIHLVWCDTAVQVVE